MEKEYLQNKSNVITLNITDGKVDSYREKEETQSTVRVYEDGKIGVAGALGDVSAAELEAQAVEKLAGGIPYPCKLNAGVKKSVLRTRPVVENKNLIPATKRLAKKVAAACPRFLVNGKTVASVYDENAKTQSIYFANDELKNRDILIRIIDKK